MMRFFKLYTAVLLAMIISSCVSYQVPTMTAGTELVLNRDDVEVLGVTTGNDWAFGLFPFWCFAPAAIRATGYAIGQATQGAYETTGADFVLQPKTKTTYYNFILFDYAEAEAVGKGARIKDIK